MQMHCNYYPQAETGDFSGLMDLLPDDKGPRFRALLYTLHVPFPSLRI